jgi:hypothetical protein
VRRWLAALAVLVLMAGCSKGDNRPRSAPTPSASAPPGAIPASPSQSPAPPSAAPSPTRAVPPRPSPSPTRRPTITLPSSPAVRLRAEPELVRQPAAGDYVYDLTGSSSGALLGVEQPYPPGAAQTVHVTPGAAGGGGVEIETVQTSAQDPGVRVTVRTRWEPGRIRLLSTVIQLPGLANHPCTYNPAPEILHVPPAAETFPQQSFSGDCSGTVDVSVTGPETVTATGRAWRTWKVHTTSRFKMGAGLTGTIDATTWLAPELGHPVRTVTVLDAQAAATRLSAHQTAVLRSHP